MQDQIAFSPAPPERANLGRFSRAGGWFWLMIVIGAILRIYCILFTAGTSDMEDWEDHATQVRDRGLIGYYHANEFANHPPFMSEAGALILRISTAVHVPFRILFRTISSLFDGANAFLLFLLLPEGRWRRFATGCYWLSPAAVLISSYHGNTDTSVAFFVLFTVWLATKGHVVSSAAAFGASLWVKLPGILALPALLAWFRNWRLRFLFAALAFVTAAVTYVPALIQDYKIVFTNVFGYRGLILQTATGVPLWGPSVLLFSTFAPIQTWPESCLRPVLFLLEHSRSIALAAIVILAWLRRHHASATEVCATIGMSYAVLFGISDYWAFQYFAWALPFWFFIRWWFGVPAVLLTSMYLYSLHWLFTGNARLLGKWDFVGHPNLPMSILAIRDLAVTFFLVSACFFLVSAWLGRQQSTSLTAQNPD